MLRRGEQSSSVDRRKLESRNLTRMASNEHSPRSRLGARLAAAFFILLCLNAWLQAARDLLGVDSNPLPLTFLQLASGATALVASVLAWQRTRWAPVAAVLYGLITGTMIIAVGPLVGLGADERRALPLAAGLVLGTALLLAWYLRTITRTPVDR